MQQVKKKSKELDHYLKSVINSVPKKLDDFVSGNDTKMTYYTGNWAKDVYDNYTEKQAETIFGKVEKLKPHLTFFQSKLETFTDQDGKEWTGYDYYAKKN